jgi:hypothetical protein
MSSRAFMARRFKRKWRAVVADATRRGNGDPANGWRLGPVTLANIRRQVAWEDMEGEKADRRCAARLNRRRKTPAQERAAKRAWARMDPIAKVRMMIGIAAIGPWALMAAVGRGRAA